MYTLYIDESGDEGPPADNDIYSQWFTTGGIVVSNKDKHLFDQAHDRIIAKHFTDNGIMLPDKLKLHYHELRQKLKPYI